jgi:hypothetical protein
MRRMQIACWVTKPTDTDRHTDYVVLIARPRQQCLRKRASVLRLYVPYLSCSIAKYQTNSHPVTYSVVRMK